MTRTCRLLLRMLSAAALVMALSAQGAPIQVVVDTSSIAGTVGSLAFDFTDSASAGNTATITNFSPSGALDPATIDAFGTSGDLSSSLTLGPGNSFYLEDITFGSSISFAFDTDGLPADPSQGEAPDGLNFTLYETDRITFLLTDGPLFSYGIGEADPFFVLSDFVTQGPVTAAAPEPSAIALVAVSLLTLVVVRSFKQ